MQEQEITFCNAKFTKIKEKRDLKMFSTFVSGFLDAPRCFPGQHGPRRTGG